MAEFLLVVEGLMADGADAAMFVSEDTYMAAMFACVFAEPVHGYVWCDRHGWMRSDEACVCDDCVWEALQAQAEALREQHAAEFGEDWLDEGDRGEMAYRRINARERAEFPHGEFDDGARWREPAQALSSLSSYEWLTEPCGDPRDYEVAEDEVSPVRVHYCSCGLLAVSLNGADGKQYTLHWHGHDPYSWPCSLRHTNTVKRGVPLHVLRKLCRRYA
jgi:hypothetical protein